MAPKEKTLITVPTVTWEESMAALKLLTELKEFLKGNQEVVPKELQRLLRKDKPGSLKVTMFCQLCTENHTIKLNTNKTDDNARQICQHNTFQKSEPV